MQLLFKDLDKEVVRSELRPGGGFANVSPNTCLLSRPPHPVLKNAFHAFANEREKIITEDIGTILEMLGHRLDDKALKEAVKEVDEKDLGEIDFEPFACFAGRFVEVEEDAEAVAKELRETFLLYDREGRATGATGAESLGVD